MAAMSSETPLTISSTGTRAVTISSDDVIVPTVPAVQIESSVADDPGFSTVEHVESSVTPRSTTSSDIELLEAREEAARLAREASEARLRVLEAGSRSRRSSGAAPSSSRI